METGTVGTTVLTGAGDGDCIMPGNNNQRATASGK